MSVKSLIFQNSIINTRRYARSKGEEKLDIASFNACQCRLYKRSLQPEKPFQES